jgi:MoxR-like ATPase
MTYATNQRDIARHLAVLPGTYLMEQARKILGSTPTSKSEAIDLIAQAIVSGTVSLGQITNTTVTTPVPTPKADAAVAAAAGRAEAVALEAKGIADVAVANLGGVKAEVQKMADTLTKVQADLANRQSNVDAIKRAIAQEVAEAFGPIRAAAEANQTQAQVSAACAAPADRKTVGEVFGIDLRDIKGNPLMVDVWADPTAPAVDPNYIWQESILRALAISSNTDTPVWLGGEKGTGKTQAAMQWAARTGRAFTRINFHKYTSAEEYLGATGLVNGSTQFVAGPFLSAYTHPGAVILLDELTNIDPGEAAPLNGALESGTPRVNIGGQVWARANGVQVIAADNTLANGDPSGRYAGTRTMNSALADRFGYMVPVTWLPAAAERDALQRITGCSSELASLVVDMLTLCRAKAASGDLVDAPSIRSAIAWIRAMPTMGVRAAWDIAVAARQPSESVVQLEALYQSQISESEFANAL